MLTVPFGDHTLRTTALTQAWTLHLHRTWKWQRKEKYEWSFQKKEKSDYIACLNIEAKGEKAAQIVKFASQMSDKRAR